MSDGSLKRQGIDLTLNSRAKFEVSDQGIVGKRVIAYIIDAIILFFIGVAITIVNIMSFGLLTPIVTVVMIALPIAYHTYLISSPRQATIGQKAMGLMQVNSDTGERLNWQQAIIQVVLFYMTLWMTGGLLLLWCLFDNKGRCLHDILSNTSVIKDNSN